MNERVSDEKIKRVTTVAKLGASANPIISLVNALALGQVRYTLAIVDHIDPFAPLPAETSTFELRTLAEDIVDKDALYK